MRLLRILVASLVLLGLMSAPVTAARRTTFASHLKSIRDHTDGDAVVAITGRVVSPKAQCISGREVRVRLEGVNVFYGAGTTDAQGNFTVTGLGPRDQVYRITLLVKRIGGARCGGDVVVDELG